MSTIPIENLLREIEDILNTSTQLPLTQGKVILEPGKILAILDEIHDSLPNEFNEARNITKNRTTIIQDAKNESAEIIAMAEQRRARMLEENEIVIKAKEEANTIMNAAMAKSQDMHRAADEYVDSQMQRVDDLLTNNLNNFKEARENIYRFQQNGR